MTMYIEFTEPICKHTRTEYRYIDYPTQGRAVYQECMTCGAQVRRLKKIEFAALDFDKVKPFDYEVRKNYWDAINKLRNEHFQQQREAQDEEWNAAYREYLQSPQWKKIRQKVLSRANWTCQGCGERPANQVHHLTYERLGHEMLFDLVAICETCHNSIPNKFRGDVKP